MLNISSGFDLKVKEVERCVLNKVWNTVYFNPAFCIVPMTRIFLPVAGYGELIQNGKLFKIEKGMALLIPPFAKTTVSCPEYLEKYWTAFNLFVGTSRYDIFSASPECLRLEIDDFGYYERLFKTMVNTFKKSGTAAQFEFNAAAACLMAPFINMTKILPEESHMSAFTRLMAYIDSHLAEKLTLSKLARYSGVSPAYLSCLFRKNTGMRLFEYINANRMNYARWHLRENSHSMSEIAEMVGIPDQARFSKIFKKTFDVSPSDYKKLFINKKTPGEIS